MDFFNGVNILLKWNFLLPERYSDLFYLEKKKNLHNHFYLMLLSLKLLIYKITLPKFQIANLTCVITLH